MKPEQREEFKRLYFQTCGASLCDFVDSLLAAVRDAAIEQCAQRLADMPEKRLASLGPRTGASVYMDGYHDACGDCEDEIRALSKAGAVNADQV